MTDNRPEKLIKDVERQSDVRHIARRLLERNGGGREIIMDEFSSFTSNRPRLGETPEHIVDAIADWLGNAPVIEDED
jgi:hypothetical protein